MPAHNWEVLTCLLLLAPAVGWSARTTLDSPEDLTTCVELFGPQANTAKQPQTEDGSTALTCELKGKKIGPYTAFYPDKRVRTRGQMCDDEFCGSWTRYYADGKIESIGDWDHNQPDGKWTLYHPNGKKKAEGFYKNGRRECGWASWDEDGNPADRDNERCVIAFRGGVRIRTGTEEQNPVPGTLIETGSTVITKARASITFQYPDGSKLIIGEKSTLKVNASREEVKKLFLEAGGVRGLISKPGAKPKRPRFLLGTKAAVLGVRGTEFVISAVSDSAESEFRVLEGSVEIARTDSELLDGSPAYSLREGQWISASEKGFGVVQSFDVEAYQRRIGASYPVDREKPWRLRLEVGGWFNTLSTTENRSHATAKLASDLGQSLRLWLSYPVFRGVSIFGEGELRGANLPPNESGKSYFQADRWLVSAGGGLHIDLHRSILASVSLGQHADYFLLGDSSGMISLRSRRSLVANVGFELHLLRLLGTQISVWGKGTLYNPQDWADLALLKGSALRAGARFSRDLGSFSWGINPYVQQTELSTDISQSSELVMGASLEIGVRL